MRTPGEEAAYKAGLMEAFSLVREMIASGAYRPGPRGLIDVRDGESVLKLVAINIATKMGIK